MSLVVGILDGPLEVISDLEVISFPSFECQPLRLRLKHHGAVAEENKNVNLAQLLPLVFPHVDVDIDMPVPKTFVRRSRAKVSVKRPLFANAAGAYVLSLFSQKK